MRPNILGRATDDEERLGGRQNSLSRAQLIIKAAAGTVKLSRSAIRELRVRVVRRRRRFQGPRFRIRYVDSDPGARREKIATHGKQYGEIAGRLSRKSANGSEEGKERNGKGERENGRRPTKSRPGTSVIAQCDSR